MVLTAEDDSTKRKGHPSATLSTTSHTHCPGIEPKPPQSAASDKLPIRIAQFSRSVCQYHTLKSDANTPAEWQMIRSTTV